jgi:hypothetical protein
MTISFPNHSRSYDGSYRRVRFLGYDGVMQVAFFLQADAHQSIDPSARVDEASLLRVFDRNRDRILDVASGAYRATRKPSYFLAAADFLASR